jgi:hypothetical protein
MLWVLQKWFFFCTCVYVRARGKQLKTQFKKKKKKKDQTGPNIYKFLSFLPQDFYFCFLPKKKKKIS